MGDDDLLAEQRAFYRARAPHYDEWWQRQGRYDRSDRETQEWQRQVARVDAALASFGATGAVLELAGGTGWWTQRLAQTAEHLTVLDASPETLELNRQRIGRTDIDYVVTDIFAWQPNQTWDVAFFSFWLSHVPRARFSEFWSLVGSCLAPDGRVFLIDNRPDPTPTPTAKDPYVVEYAPDLHLRRLNDGSHYRVVKVTYEPDELEGLLDAHGWHTQLDATRWFVFGAAQPH